ncbi:hypothetical protein Fcan01_15363 [Folsomia candida]|uniref:Uncharacterized protein n=1 Tax=Folsomia candida TaxID=158441 RepID=A0A226DVS6_FOLCA|nr:hypothetical protein Fcan01_15363 [Folsomia candida]
MVKLTLTFWVVTLITCLAQGESRAIESVDFDLEDGFNYTCPPYCDYCTDDDTSCRYYPDARNEEGGMPWGLILVSALVSAFFFCILPLWIFRDVPHPDINNYPAYLEVMGVTNKSSWVT